MRGKSVTDMTYIMLAIMVLCFAGSSVLASDSGGETIEVLTAKISSAREKDFDLQKKIVAKINSIKEAVENYNKSDREMRGITGLGQIEQLELKAQRYSIERQARKIFEKEINELVELTKKWEDTKHELVSARKMLEVRKQMLDADKVDKNDKTKVAYTKDAIEYYEVKKDATLKDISALPDVYNNAASWKYLYDANREVVKDATKLVPAGTVLIVPDLKVDKEFEDLE